MILSRYRPVTVPLPSRSVPNPNFFWLALSIVHHRDTPSLSVPRRPYRLSPFPTVPQRRSGTVGNGQGQSGTMGCG
jgi:hypothetical protein